MNPLRALGYAGRFLLMGVVLGWFLAVYAFGRVGALFVRGEDPRRRALAVLRGSVLRRAMTALGATFVKLGQVMSTRPDLLDPEIIDELRKLQDRLPAFPGARVRAVIAAELGAPVDARFAELDDAPIAAGSVAQVHRGLTHDGREVAVKVLRPGVRERVERDAAILGLFARMAAWHPDVRLSDPVGHLDHFIRGILDQTDLRLERDNYGVFRQLFATTPGVHFPGVHPELSAQRVMTMELLRGRKLDALPEGVDYADVARRLQLIFFKMVFEDGFVHADLHPGNLLLLDNGDIAVFDVGLVKRLGEDILVQVVDFTRCLVMGGTKDFVAHIRRFHTYRTNVDWEALETDLGHFLEHFRRQNIAELELGALLSEILALGRRYRVRPVADLALVMVAMVTAEGLGKQLNSDANLFNDVAAFLGPVLAKRGMAPASAA